MMQALYADEGRLDRMGEVLRLGYGSGVIDYYRIVDLCMSKSPDCLQTIRTYTGSSDRIHILKKNLDDAVQISSDESYHRLSLAGKLYEQHMYRASESLASSILRDRPDYREAQKVSAFSLFEL